MDATIAEAALAAWDRGGFQTSIAQTLEETLSSLAAGGIDAVLLDLNLPDSRGLQTFEIVQEAHPLTAIVLLSGIDDENTALEAVQRGAQDYLFKGGISPDVVARSVTYAVQRKRSERMLVEAMAEARLANQAKSAFLANMSHELRTPLNAILGFSEIMTQETFGKISPPRYLDYANDIHDRASHLAALIGEILEFSSLEFDKGSFNDVDIDVAEIVNAAMQLMRSRAEAAGATLVADLGPVPLRLSADRRAVSQVLVHLLDNAIKFGHGGPVVVTSQLCEGGELSLAVADEGIGMSAEQLAEIKASFSHAQNVFQRAHGGVGLGLAIVEKIATAHDAVLALESQENRGTTACVTFPSSRVRCLAAKGVA